MSGKKFVVVFLGLILVSGVFLSLWIKHGYESRPLIKVEDEKK